MKLEDLKVGDVVVVRSIYSESLRKVDRTTKTQVILSYGGNSKSSFNRQTGYRCGRSNGFTREYIRPATDEDIARISKKRLVNRLSCVRKEALEILPLDTLCAIEKLIFGDSDAA